MTSKNYLPIDHDAIRTCPKDVSDTNKALAVVGQAWAEYAPYKHVDGTTRYDLSRMHVYLITDVKDGEVKGKYKETVVL